jgi:GAF domain-containing protein
MQLTRDFNQELDTLRCQYEADFGIVSHISGDEYTILALATDSDLFNVGDRFETADTYCREVISSNAVIDHPCVGDIHAMRLHPIYTALQLEAYLGLPLRVQGGVVGTLNFTAFEPRVNPLSQPEIQAAKILAAEIEQSLAA